MKKKSFLLSVALMLTASVAAQTNRLWTLQQCLDYAMQHNITLQRARLQLQSAKEDVSQSKAALLPSLNASTSHNLGYRPWQDSGITTVTNGTVNTKVDKTSYNGSYGLNASWTVWNGNRNRNQVKLNQLTEEQAELETQVTANSIQEQIAQLYVQILYLTEAVKVNEESLKTSQKNEERGKEMVEVGKMSKADLAQLTAQRSTDEYNIVSAQTQVKNYKLQLKQLLEITDGSEFDIVIPATTDEQALAEVPLLMSVYEQALATRPEIQSAEMAIKSSDVSLDIAKAGRMPTVSLSASAGTSTNSLANNGWGNQMKFNFNSGAGVNVSVPLFDQRQTKTNVAKARIQRENNLLALQDKQKQLYQTIENYWLDATTNQQRFRAAQATVDSEQLSYSLLQEKFNVGLTNIVELMTGKDRLLQAEQNRLQSKYMTLLNLQMLKFYGGELKN
ncbi:MAG: TolC family protein [Prevotella sp.]|nr:TolC family protein [Prevotella sp.]